MKKHLNKIVLFFWFFNATLSFAAYDKSWVRACEQAVEKSQAIHSDTSRALFVYFGHLMDQHSSRYFHSSWGSLNCKKLAKDLTKDDNLSGITTLSLSHFFDEEVLGRLSHGDRYNGQIFNKNVATSDLGKTKVDLEFVAFFFPNVEKLNIDHEILSGHGILKFPKLNSLRFHNVTSDTVSSQSIHDLINVTTEHSRFEIISFFEPKVPEIKYEYVKNWLEKSNGRKLTFKVHHRGLSEAKDIFLSLSEVFYDWSHSVPAAPLQKKLWQILNQKTNENSHFVIRSSQLRNAIYSDSNVDFTFLEDIVGQKKADEIIRNYYSKSKNEKNLDEQSRQQAVNSVITQNPYDFGTLTNIAIRSLGDEVVEQHHHYGNLNIVQYLASFKNESNDDALNNLKKIYQKWGEKPFLEKNENGFNSLHIALYFAAPKTAQFLISIFSAEEINIPSHEGHSPLAILFASQVDFNDFQDIYRSLSAKGACRDSVDHDGDNIVQNAMMCYIDGTHESEERLAYADQHDFNFYYMDKGQNPLHKCLNYHLDSFSDEQQKPLQEEAALSHLDDFMRKCEVSKTIKRKYDVNSTVRNVLGDVKMSPYLSGLYKLRYMKKIGSSYLYEDDLQWMATHIRSHEDQLHYLEALKDIQDVRGLSIQGTYNMVKQLINNPNQHAKQLLSSLTYHHVKDIYGDEHYPIFELFVNNKQARQSLTSYHYWVASHYVMYKDLVRKNFQKVIENAHNVEGLLFGLLSIHNVIEGSSNQDFHNMYEAIFEKSFVIYKNETTPKPRGKIRRYLKNLLQLASDNNIICYDEHYEMNAEVDNMNRDLEYRIHQLEEKVGALQISVTAIQERISKIEDQVLYLEDQVQSHEDLMIHKIMPSIRDIENRQSDFHRDLNHLSQEVGKIGTKLDNFYRDYKIKTALEAVLGFVPGATAAIGITMHGVDTLLKDPGVEFLIDQMIPSHEENFKPEKHKENFI